jgi:hypothetical protein
MTKEQEAKLFDHLMRVPQFKQWVLGQMDRQVEILKVNVDHAVILKTQGACSMLKLILDRLDAAESAAKRQ